MLDFTVFVDRKCLILHFIMNFVESNRKPLLSANFCHGFFQKIYEVVHQFPEICKKFSIRLYHYCSVNE